MNRYLIIGAGAAGVSAIEAIRSQDKTSEITQVFDETAGYYSRPGLAYYLTGEIDESSLYPLHKSYFDRLHVRQVCGRVKRIMPGEHWVELNNGKALSYNRLLIATGARAAPAKVPGIDLKGVVKLDCLDDVHSILSHARRRRTAVIVGGGITALELVEGLRVRGLYVHYFLRGERYWSNVLDGTESRIVERRLRDEGVQVHYQTELAEILGKRGHVVGVRTTGGKEIKCDVVGIAIGILPRKELAIQAGLKTERGIAVNEYLNTNDGDIYAAGDTTEVYDPSMGRAILDSLWAPARKQGYIAGLNMTGMRVPYSKGVAFNVTRLAGLTTTIIGAVGGRDVDADVVGIVRGESEGWRQIADAIAMQADFDISRLRILVGENQLLGALLMGDQTLSRVIHQMIVEKMDITPIRERLLRSGSTLIDTIADFWECRQGKQEYAPIEP